MFEHVDAYAGDPILTLVETFNKDTRESKVNLGIGLYYDEAGRIPLLESVRQAEAALGAQRQPAELVIRQRAVGVALLVGERGEGEAVAGGGAAAEGDRRGERGHAGRGCHGRGAG